MIKAVHKGIKLYSDFDIDLNITSFLPTEHLRLFIAKQNQNIEWAVDIGEHFNKYKILAYVDKNPIYAPLSGTIEKTALIDFKGSSCYFCYINTDKEQLPSFPVLDVTDDPKNIFELKQVAKEAAIADDYRRKSFCDILDNSNPFKELVLICADDQPYTLTKTAMLLNFYDEVFYGFDIIARALKIEKQTLAVINNFKIKSFLKSTEIKYPVKKMVMRYPLYSAINKEAQKTRALIISPEVCRAVYRAVIFKEPQTTKVITAWGSAIEEPKILEVPIGTAVQDILKVCSAYKVVGKIVASGVLSGYLTAPYFSVTKYDDSITAITENENLTQTMCINCGKCISICPESLAPYYILQKPFFKAKSNKMLDTFKYCTGCGCCSYVCPARIPLKSYIKAYNQEIKRQNNE